MHFCIYVIGNDDLTQALEPFQENNMGTVDEHYLEFIDRTEEVNKEWRDYPLTCLAGEGFEQDFKNIEEFAKDWFGYEATSGGRYGYTANPNAKWDWWELGGRWANMIPLKGTRAETNQAYIEDINLDALKVTSAILYKGKWIEGEAKNLYNWTDEEEEAWEMQTKALFSDLPPGTIVSVVDCHI